MSPPSTVCASLSSWGGDEHGQAETVLALRVERFEQPVQRAGLGE